MHSRPLSCFDVFCLDRRANECLSCNGLSAEEAQTDLLGSRVALSRTCATNRGLDFFHSVMLISEVDSRSLKGKFFESKLYVEI